MGYSNDDLIDAVDRIRSLNGEEPVTYRGIKKKFYLTFRTADKTEIYYKVQDVIKFIDGVRKLESLEELVEAYSDDIIR